MKNRGFSLLELMIVVAIVMIMGAGTMWGFKGRMYKNEILRMKTAIPTIINNATLRVYEKATSGSSITVSSDKISISSVGSGAEYSAKTSMFTFATSPATIDGTIVSSGTFRQNFDILVYNEGTSTVALTFKINTKENLGVYNITTSQGSF